MRCEAASCCGGSLCCEVTLWGDAMLWSEAVRRRHVVRRRCKTSYMSSKGFFCRVSAKTICLLFKTAGQCHGLPGPCSPVHISRLPSPAGAHSHGCPLTLHLSLTSGLRQREVPKRCAPLLPSLFMAVCLFASSPKHSRQRKLPLLP